MRLARGLQKVWLQGCCSCRSWKFYPVWSAQTALFNGRLRVTYRGKNTGAPSVSSSRTRDYFACFFLVSSFKNIGKVKKMRRLFVLSSDGEQVGFMLVAVFAYALALERDSLGGRRDVALVTLLWVD